MKTLKIQAKKGIKWTAIATASKSFFHIIQLIVLARYLNAEDFGLVAIVMVVMGFSQIFLDMGISNAIIYKQDVSNLQLSSLYWINIATGLVFTITLFLLAPVIALFYNELELTLLLQTLSVTFIINAIGNQYRVLLKKMLMFKILAKIEIIAIFISFVFAVLLALKGYGPFSLIYSALLSSVILNLFFVTIGQKLHKLELIYNYQEIKSFLSFGLYQMGQNSIIYFNNQFDIILIGKLLGTEVLGVYSVIKQLVMRPAQIVNPIVTTVSFPIMAKIQNDELMLKSMYLRIINTLSSINFPIYILMIVLSTPLITLLLGNNWLLNVHMFQILSIYALIRSTTSPAGSLLMAKGRADIGFWWSLSEFLFMPLAIWIGSLWGVIGVSVGLLSFQLIYLLPNWFFIVKKMCNASFKEYFNTQFKPLISMLITIIITLKILNTNEFSNFTIIMSVSVISISVYLFLSHWINRDFINMLKEILTKAK